MSGPLTRRAALTAFAAAPALALLPAVAPARCSNAVAEAIAFHCVAWNALGETCNLTDRVLAEQEGRIVTPADELTYRDARDAERAAQDRIFGMAISSVAEMRAFVEWATWHFDIGDGDIPERLLETLRRAPVLVA